MTVRAKPMLTALVLANSIVIAVPAWADTPAAPKDDGAAIAARFSDAFKRGEVLPRELLAEKIMVTHVPALPIDPEVAYKKTFGINDRAVLKKAMKDFHIDVISTVPETNGFTVKIVVKGTPASGKKYSSPITLHFVVANGVVIALQASQNPDERTMLAEIEKEGSSEAPPFIH